MVEGHVPQGVEVQVLSSAFDNEKSPEKGIFFYMFDAAVLHLYPIILYTVPLVLFAKLGVKRGSIYLYFFLNSSAASFNSFAFF